MHSITLGDKTYTVPVFVGRTYRTIGPVEDIYLKVSGGGEDVRLLDEEKDELVAWFCAAFGNQFTMDEVYDHYPVDDLVRDIFALYIAVLNMSTKVLRVFPIPAVTTGPASK